MSFRYRLIKFLWYIATPVFLFVRRVQLDLGILHHDFRQKYLIGVLAPGKTAEELHAYLREKGFQNNFIAWVDKDEILNIRKLDGFHFQYHLRIFPDGEVRGHYERTPEMHPFGHWWEKGMEPRREEFLKMLEGWIVG